MDDEADVKLFTALERWWDASRSGLAVRGVTATLKGPYDAAGMDPVYILNMDGERRETEMHLFRGGTVLFQGFDKHALAEIQASSAEVTSEDDLTDVLIRFAERA